MPYQSRYLSSQASPSPQPGAPALGILVPDANNPVHMENAERIARCASPAGYRVEIADAENDSEKERKNRDHLLDMGVSGLFVGSVGVDLHAMYEHLPVPCVLMGSRTQAETLDYVVLDDYHGAYLVFKQLVSCGHRRIAFLSYPQAQGYSALDRMNGFRKSVKRSEAAGLDVTIETLPSERLLHSCEAALGLLRQPNPPTAIVAQNDYIAYGAMQAIEQCGFFPGKDIALVGFDDLLISSLPKMRLSSVTCDGAPLAERAFALMMRRLREPSRSGRCGILLPPRLIYRGSFTGVAPC